MFDHFIYAIALLLATTFVHLIFTAVVLGWLHRLASHHWSAGSAVRRSIVLGGVALTGGIGSVIAVIPAGVILFFLNPILTAMGIDPQGAQVIQGLLIVFVMAVTGILEWRRRRRS